MNRQTADHAQQEERRARIDEKIQPVLQAHAAAAAASAEGGAAKPCNTCGGSFATPALYRAHFKSDWHRFNQKLKLSGQAPVSEEEFDLCDAESFFGK